MVFSSTTHSGTPFLNGGVSIPLVPPIFDLGRNIPDACLLSLSEVNIYTTDVCGHGSINGISHIYNEMRWHIHF